MRSTWVVATVGLGALLAASASGQTSSPTESPCPEAEAVLRVGARFHCRAELGDDPDRGVARLVWAPLQALLHERYELEATDAEVAAFEAAMERLEAKHRAERADRLARVNRDLARGELSPEERARQEQSKQTLESLAEHDARRERERAALTPAQREQVRAGNEAVVGFYRRLGYAVEERVSMGKLLG